MQMHTRARTHTYTHILSFFLSETEVHNCKTLFRTYVPNISIIKS